MKLFIEARSLNLENELSSRVTAIFFVETSIEVSLRS